HRLFLVGENFRQHSVVPRPLRKGTRAVQRALKKVERRRIRNANDETSHIDHGTPGSNAATPANDSAPSISGFSLDLGLEKIKRSARADHRPSPCMATAPHHGGAERPQMREIIRRETPLAR